MSRQEQSIAETAPLGGLLRELREKRGLTLREVAPAADLDSTLLSKIELGQRLPTRDQALKLAGFFGLPEGEIEGRRITEKFLRDHQGNPALAEAVQRLREVAPAYVVNKPVNKRGKTSG